MIVILCEKWAIFALRRQAGALGIAHWRIPGSSVLGMVEVAASSRRHPAQLFPDGKKVF
jgi:hypothetical protein